MSNSDDPSRLSRVFDRWAFDEYRYSAVDLAVYRIIYGCTALLFGLPDLDRVKGLPAAALRTPPGPFSLMTRWPPDWVPETLEILLLVGIVMILVGYRTAVASCAVSLLWFASLGLIFSTGKISHSTAVFSVVPVFMAFAGWGERFSIDAARRGSRPARVRAWPMALGALLVALMFWSAARPKIAEGWLSLDTQAVHRIVIDRVYILETGNSFSAWLADSSNSVAWELLDWATILLEVALLVLILRRRWFLTGLGFAVFFHTANYAIFEISFLLQVIAYGAFVPWGTILRRLDRPLGALRRRLRPVPGAPVPIVLAAGVALAAAARWYAERYDSPFGAVPFDLKKDLEPYFYGGFVVAVLLYFALGATRLVGAWRRRPGAAPG